MRWALFTMKSTSLADVEDLNGVVLAQNFGNSRMYCVIKTTKGKSWFAWGPDDLIQYVANAF